MTHPITASARALAAELAAKPSIRWNAFYEDFDKAVNAAKRVGYTGAASEEVADYVDLHDYITSKEFDRQTDAIAWLEAAIKYRKTTYGVGELRAQERPRQRCRYCDCGGWIDVTSFLVDDEGIAEESKLDSPCLN
jgi:hypothetical protein